MTVFRQICDPSNAAFAYVLGDSDAGEALAIDASDGAFTPTLLALLAEFHLDLRYLLETHAHPGQALDAVHATWRDTGASIVGSGCGASRASIHVKDGATITFGNELVRVIATPGHTASCLSFLWRDRLFTGDALWIGGCGETSSPDANPALLYDSVTQRLLSLPGETLVFPGHDPQGRTVSTIAEERDHNPCFALLSRDEFVTARRAQSNLSKSVAGRLGSNVRRAHLRGPMSPRGGPLA